MVPDALNPNIAPTILTYDTSAPVASGMGEEVVQGCTQVEDESFVSLIPS